jgi:hypothetical protein
MIRANGNSNPRGERMKDGNCRDVIARILHALRRSQQRIEAEPVESVRERAFELWWDMSTAASYSYQEWEQDHLCRWFEEECEDGWPLLYLVLSDLVQEFGSKEMAERLHAGCFLDRKSLARFLTRLGVRRSPETEAHE